MDYEKKYKEALERASKLRFQNPFDTVSQMMEHVFPELKESEDERIRKWIIDDIIYNMDNEPLNNSEYKKEAEKAIAWLEKQGEQKPKWSEEDDKMIDWSIINLAELMHRYGAEYGKVGKCIDWLKSLKQRMEEHEKQDVQNLASPAKPCENDTLLDLLNKMPSYITVDGIFYHFMLRKTALAYTAYYAGEEEGSGKVIFGITAHSPIDLLTDMLEELKEKGLLEGGQHE